MDLITILSTLWKYGLWAIAAVGVLIVIYAVTFLIYKKVFHGSKTPAKMQWFALILLSAWFIVVLGITTFSRGANYTGQANFSLFSGYINAWNKWSYEELQLIIFNMLMFSPLGFLLPLFTKKGEKFSCVCLASFAVTFFIEVIQLITGRGIFELDDLLHNFMGSIFGYLVIMFILKCVREKKMKWAAFVKMSVLPLVYVLLILSAMIAYHSQKYGNMPFVPAEKQNMSVVAVDNQADLSSERKSVSVYKNKYSNNFEHGKQISKNLSELLETEFKRTVRAEGNNKIFESDTNGSQLTYFMDNASWSYTNWQEGSVLNDEIIASGREKIESWLNNSNLLPSNAVFSVQNDTILRWDVEAVDIQNSKSDYISGIIMVQLDENGEIVSFDYHIVYNDFVEQAEMISSDDAYAQILNGNFEQYTPLKKGDKLYINGCQIDYAYDTKGFYRPVYTFDGYVNTEDNVWNGVVSAIN